MGTVINLDILDKDLKPAHINVFLHLVRLSENNEVTISITELMPLVKCNNRKRVIEYLRILKENDIIDFSSEVNQANTYKINPKYFFK